MATIFRFIERSTKYLTFSESRRNISLSPITRLLEINEKTDGNTLFIDGIIKPDPKEHLRLKAKNDACIICSSGINVKHTDVLILSQFVRSDGCMLPRRTTGLCKIQQKRIGIMVTMAQKAGLMPNLAPEGSKKDPQRRRYWKKFNTYFDEGTIQYKYSPCK